MLSRPPRREDPERAARRRAAQAGHAPDATVLPSRRRLAVRGAVALLVLAAVVLIGWQRPNPFSRDLVVRAQVEDASGLRPGSEVRVAGSAAGEVTDVRALGGAGRGRVELTLHVDRDAGPIRADATVAVWPRLAFEGTSYVELGPGSSREGLGDRPIGVERTTVYVPMDRVLRLADGPTRAAIRADAAGLARASDATTSDAVRATVGRAPSLLARTARVAAAARGPKAGGRALRRAVAGLARTGDAVADRSADLVPLLRDATSTARAARGDGALRATLAALPASLRAVRQGSADADVTLARLDGLTGDLRAGLPDVGPTLERARPTTRRVARIARVANPWVRDLRGALRDGAASAGDAQRLAATLRPVARRLDGSLLPALERPTPTLKLPSYLAFLNMFAGGGGASRAFQRPGQSSLGDGHFMRFGIRFLTGIGAPLPPCGDVRAANPQIAQLLSSLELCTP